MAARGPAGGTLTRWMKRAFVAHLGRYWLLLSRGGANGGGRNHDLTVSGPHVSASFR